jgi:hypothetical protein
MTGKELIQAWVSSEIKESVRKAAIADDINVSLWVRRAIKEKIERDLPSRPQ